MARQRITISLSSKNDDAATVMRALESAPHWRRSAELIRWAAAYLNGESMAKAGIAPEPEADGDEMDELFDAL